MAFQDFWSKGSPRTGAGWKAPSFEEISGGVEAGAGGSRFGLRVPKYDQSRVTGLAQEQVAAGIGKMRRELQRVQAGRYGSPVARGEAIRGGIRGFGEALAPLQAAATRTATGLYEPEYRRELLEFERAQRESEREEIATTRRGLRDPSGETYREATQRLLKGQAGDIGLPRTAAEEGRVGLPGGGSQEYVNPQYWPQGVEQQREAKLLSEKHGVPLSSFYGQQTPAAVVKNLVKHGA